MSTTDLVAKVFEWVAAGERRAFQLEYGYGICEVPWLTLWDAKDEELVEVYDGPLAPAAFAGATP